jgi:Fic family protein
MRILQSKLKMTNLNEIYKRTRNSDKFPRIAHALADFTSKRSIDPLRFANENYEAEIALSRLSVLEMPSSSLDWIANDALKKEAIFSAKIDGVQLNTQDVASINDSFELKEFSKSRFYVDQIISAYKFLRKNINLNLDQPLSYEIIKNAQEIYFGTSFINIVRPDAYQRIEPLVKSDKASIYIHKFDKCMKIASNELPNLIRIALISAQFQVINPLPNSNSVFSRLIIPIMVESWKKVYGKNFYLSGYFYENKMEYHELISRINSNMEWENWIVFFLKAIKSNANRKEKMITEASKLIITDRAKIFANANSSMVTYKIFELLAQKPIFKIEDLCMMLSLSFPAVNSAVKTLIDLRIVQENTGNKRNRQFSYQNYIDLFC